MKILITCVIDLGRLYIMLSVSLIFTNHLIDRYQCNDSVTMPFAIRVHGLVFTSASRIHLYTSICDLSQDDDNFYPVGHVVFTRTRSQRQYQRVQKNCRTLLLLWILRYTDASLVIIVEHHLKNTSLRGLSVLDVLCGLEYLTTIKC